eukprot:TRINITY_DN3268_c0_g1_i8.p2 TRINITY_DN3268_c0_g1~~TRINITY_DN3268_c0_g1_i8.p2  ORF type:complete len:139 (-),score=42.96 TRINITY_DN3268_c0_g1_i8:192-587(-)
MIRRPPRSTHCISSAASDVYKRQYNTNEELSNFSSSEETHPKDNMQLQDMEDQHMLDSAVITGWKIEDNQKVIDEIEVGMRELSGITREMAETTEKADAKLECIGGNTRSAKRHTAMALGEVEKTVASRSV